MVPSLFKKILKTLGRTFNCQNSKVEYEPTGDEKWLKNVPKCHIFFGSYRATEYKSLPLLQHKKLEISRSIL